GVALESIPGEAVPCGPISFLVGAVGRLAVLVCEDAGAAFPDGECWLVLHKRYGSSREGMAARTGGGGFTGTTSGCCRTRLARNSARSSCKCQAVSSAPWAFVPNRTNA